MKLLYGVVGEGMGHAMRSRVVITHLLRAGHEVEVIASDRAVDYLRRHFPEVHRIHGLHIITEENRVRKGSTLWTNLRDGLTAIPAQIAAYFKLVDDFRPEAVISDFESWTYFYAKAQRIPVVSIDNMQVINRCSHGADVLHGHEAEFEITKAFIKGKLPFCDHYFITTFFRPPIRKPDTTLVPPILRPEILAAQRNEGAHLLVYQTAEGNNDLAEALTATGIECRVYGMRRTIKEEQVEGNLRYRPFSEDVFIQDLASARAVVSGGGFTLLSEAVYLRKPILSVPIRGQFEQVMNGRYVEKEGYGLAAPAVTQDVMARFIANLPAFQSRLASYVQDGNEVLFQALDETLDRLAAGIR